MKLTKPIILVGTGWCGSTVDLQNYGYLPPSTENVSATAG
jgi:hypothetical protein